VPAGARERLLVIVKAQLEAMTPAPGLVALGYRDWTRLNERDYPACLIELGSGTPGDSLRHPGLRLRERIPFDTYGIVNTGLTGDGRQLERERFLIRVQNVLEGPTILEALISDSNENGGGTTDLEVDGPPAVDQGMPPDTPFGVFRVPMIAIMHVTRGAR
jgi:hypothetical protein